MSSRVAGERIAMFVAKNLVLFGVLGGVGVAAGGALASMNDRLYYTDALIEVGARAPNEPLENPIIAAERLAGHLSAMARRFDARATSSVTNRRDKNHAITRFLDANVLAHTASAAASILSGATAALVDEEHAMHAYERTLVEQEIQYQLRAADRVRAAFGRGEGDADVLAAELYETHRLINERSLAMSPIRMPDTRVLSKSGATPLGSKLVGLASAGLLFGLLLAAVIAGAGTVVQGARGVR
jgi:hypothetical protein